MPELNPEHYAAMQRQPWDEIIPRLMNYALSKARRRYWQGIFGGWMPGGLEANDIAMQAIEKIFSGERRWDSQKEPNLFKVLTSIADSIVSHLAHGWENNRVRSGSALSANTGDDGDGAHQTANYPDPIDSPSAAAIQQEREKESREFLSQLHEFLGDERDLQKAVDCIWDGTAKRADIAAHIGISAKAMTNVRKKLQVRLKQFLTRRNQTRPFLKGEPADV